MLPTVPLGLLFGKLLWVALDLYAGVLARRIAAAGGAGARRFAALAVLLNPLAINVSTRGNCDALILVLVFGTLLLLRRGRHDAAAVV